MPVKMRGASADGGRGKASSMRAAVLERHHHVPETTGARLVPLRSGARRVRCSAGVRERKDGAPEAGADQTRTVDPALRAQRVGQRVELRDRDLEILAQRRVRRIDERAAAGQVASSQRRDERANAFVLSDDVTYPT